MSFYAESVKKFSCWDCQYFKAEDSENEVNGWCRKNAPRSADLYGFSKGGGTPNVLVYQAAMIDKITNRDGALTQSGQIEGALAYRSKPITSSSSFQAGTNFPFFGLPNSRIYHMLVCLGSAAVGGPGPPVSPFVKIDFFNETGSSRTNLGTVNVPLDSLTTKTMNNPSPLSYQQRNFTLPTPIVIPNLNMWGFELDLSVTDDSQMSAFDVINVACYVEQNFLVSAGGGLTTANPDDLTEEESFAKYSIIEVAPNMWCGEYKHTNKVVPAIPPWTPPTP